MITDLEKGEFGLEGSFDWELFGEVIDVHLYDDVDVEYAEKCAESLQNLPEETVQAIWEAAKRYCLHFINICGDEWDDWNEMSIDVTEDMPAEEIKTEIYPSVLIVDKPEGDGIGFHLECGCTWEVEHGLEITILDGKLVYLGPFESCGAWDNFPPDKVWNFVNDVDRTGIV